ncbi:MAG: hypothetical protein HY751_00180 [Nitrospinae bacterium]|nr:hypothetical protein [Nitrospinota bacterium]
MKFFRMFTVLAALAATFTAIGCATAPLGIDEPYRITAEKVGNIKEGVTTREDLKTMFGEPDMKVSAPEGAAYFYKDINLSSLWVEFTDDWTVSDYKWSE